MYKTTEDIYVQFVILKQEEHISPDISPLFQPFGAKRSKQAVCIG